MILSGLSELISLYSVFPLILYISEKNPADRINNLSGSFNIFSKIISNIGLGYFSKAFQIVKFLINNSKENPIVLILGSLHTYFQKLILLKTVGNDITRVGINPYFIEEYKRVSERFSVKQISQALEYILEADLKSKGIGGYNKKDETLLEELILKLFSIKN